MLISKYFKNTLILATTLVGLILSQMAIKDISTPKYFISKQESSLNLNYNLLKYFHLGQKRMISSLYWISTILESDVEHYETKDLSSWMFLRFNTISLLDPLFLKNYEFGGTYLSIIKDDIQGATFIFDKGLKYYPNDFSLLKNAGFHYYFEAAEYEKAYTVFSRLKNHPSIDRHLMSTLARLESERGNLADAFTIITNIYNNLNKDDLILNEKMRSYLYSIKAELDLLCLNTSKNNDQCEKVDLDGNKYIFAEGNYKAVRAWIPYRIKKKNL